MTDGLVVVGGGPAGHAAASAYRDAGGDGPVRLLSLDADPPYHRPPLSKGHLRGETAAADLPLEDESYYAERDITIRLSTTVSTLDTAARRVTTSDGSSFAYSQCVLATGARPARLPVPGGTHPDILALRSWRDGHRLAVRARSARSAVVVGSGFIGCEAAISLAMTGCDVTLVSNERAPQLSRLGEFAADHIAGWLDEYGVHCVLDSSVASFDEGHLVRVDDGTTHVGDLVLTAVGVLPNGQLAEAAGLPVQNGRVVVDAQLRTTDARVWCAGDAALAHNAAAGRRLAVEHWGEAMTMGQIAGSNSAGQGELSSWADAPGFWSELGTHTLKYAAWGDGFDETRPVEREDGGFTVWYGRDGICVGVLTHEADDDYEPGKSLVEAAGPLPG